MRKLVKGFFPPSEPYWVGNGFPVRNFFNYSQHAALVSPFLLLDYAGPAEFSPSVDRRGVGAHPHRGFETVTIVYDGEVSHRDTTGNGGTIGPGDVQWMTAAGGLLHDEFHSEAFTRSGGRFEVVQLWVNLPAKHKMDDPHYQALTRDNIPVVALANQAGNIRVIAGQYGRHSGIAKTYTPINVWDIRLWQRAKVDFSLPDGHVLIVLVRKGDVRIEGTVASSEQMLQLSQSGTEFTIEAETDADLLVLSGEPIPEPVAGHGPFVMNTRQELVQAFHDFEAGKFGVMPAE